MGAKEVIGIDYGDQGLKVAKLNYKKTKNLKFKKMNVLNLNFKDNTFDVVFLTVFFITQLIIKKE